MTMMNATAVPTAAPVATASAPAAAASASTEVPAGDFLLMLGQLLGTPVAGGTAKTTTTVATTDEGDAAEAALDAAMVTGVPLPVIAQMQSQPNGDVPAAALMPVTAKATDVLSARTGLEIPAELLNAKGSEEMGTPAPAAPHVQSLDGAQQLRSAAVADGAASRPVQQHVGTSAWAQEIGTRMIMMTERGQHSASLRLSPEHLGPLEVRIAVRDDQASVWFGAAHADTRAAIEQALPKLRELFAEQGLSLADAGVHHQAPREQGKSVFNHGADAVNGADDAGATATPIAIKLGLVDAYA
jgi:flagellar hook-length control protein FliK